MKFNRDFFIDLAVVLGLIAAGTMAVGVSLVAAAIFSVILGGPMMLWGAGFICLDVILAMYFIAKLQDEILEGGFDERKTPME